MSLFPDQPPPASLPEKPKISAEERRLRQEDRLKTIRLRMVIGRALDERGRNVSTTLIHPVPAFRLGDQPCGWVD
jgi:hypothetical protein